jgi:hypothetical protein
MKTLTQLASELDVKFTAPESNLIAKLEKDYGVALDTSALAPEEQNKITVQNRFGFGSAICSPLVAALVAFVYACNTGGPFDPLTYNGKKVAVSIFDRTRYLVLKIDANAYSALLD